jgi:transcriptional regulator of arginine metabolism
MAKSRKERLAAIADLIQRRTISHQEELVRLLLQQGFDSTQATVSRDLKFLKITKSKLSEGGFVYVLPTRPRSGGRTSSRSASTPDFSQLPVAVSNEHKWILGVRTIERSQTLVVVRTKPGYAGSIASDIDSHALKEVMGTIAGDDTILVIPRFNYTPEQVVSVLIQELALPQ